VPAPIKIKPIAEKSEPIRYDCVLAVRALRSGPFKSLWELVQLDEKGNRKRVITDANSRGSILQMMNREIMRLVITQ